MFAIIKVVILIKKHIIKNTLTLKKVLFIGLLSLILNSNLHAQLAGPSSSWNTVIQSDVYGDAIYENDANKEDLFAKTTNTVLQSAFNGNNIYFRVLLNGEADHLVFC